MDLRRSFDEVLQMCPVKRSHISRSGAVLPKKYASLPGQKVAEVHKFAVLLVFDVDDSPSILSPADALAINHNRALRADNCERNHRLQRIASAT